MLFRSLYDSRTTNLEARIEVKELKKILKEEPERFHLKWVTADSFIISSNFSYGSNLIWDVNRPNTKSEIIYYGRITEMEESKTKIELRTRSKDLLATLLIIFPMLVLLLQTIIKFDRPVFLVQFAIFPIAIIGLLYFIRSEENGLLRIFQEHLNDEILKSEMDPKKSLQENR